jgi:hypothetical protein
MNTSYSVHLTISNMYKFLHGCILENCIALCTKLVNVHKPNVFHKTYKTICFEKEQTEG